jgi:HEAT repeat protein
VQAEQTTQISAPRGLSDDQKAVGRRKLFATSSAGMFANLVCTDRVLDSLLLFLGWGADKIGLLYVAITLTSFTPLLIGPLVARVGKLRILRVSFALTAAPVAVLTVGAMIGNDVLSELMFPMLVFYWMMSFAMNASWWSVSQDVTDNDNRGRFFGYLRTSWSSVLLVLSLFAAVWLNVDAEARLGRFMWLFVAATIGSVVRAAMIWRMPTVEDSTQLVPPLKMIGGSFKLLATHPSIRRVVLLSVLLGFAGGATTPFYGVFFRFSLGMSATAVAFTQVFFALGSPLSHLFWGFAADRFGNRPLFRLSAAGGAIICLAMAMLCSADGAQGLILFIACVLMSSILAAHSMAYTRALLNATDEKYTPFILPFTGVISSMSVLAATTACAALLGAPAVAQWRVPIAFTHLDIYKTFLLFSAGCYLVVLLASRGLPERHSYGAVDVLGPLWARPLRVLWHMYQSRMPLGEDQRAALTRKLGNSESPLAENTLIKALFDPSYEVRKTAVSALATMEPTPKVVAALISAARTKGLGISPEAVHTLGLIGAQDAAEFLANESLAISSHMVRGNAARALGRLNDMRAVDRMYEMLCDVKEHIFVRMSCAWALSRLGFVEAADEMHSFYLQVPPGHLRRELLIDMGNLIGQPKFYYTLRLNAPEDMGEFERWLAHLHQKRAVTRSGHKMLLRLLHMIAAGSHEEVLAEIRNEFGSLPSPCGDSTANRLLCTLFTDENPSLDESLLALYIMAWRLANPP